MPCMVQQCGLVWLGIAAVSRRASTSEVKELPAQMVSAFWHMLAPSAGKLECGGPPPFVRDHPIV